MRLSLIEDIPPDVSLSDLARCLEAMLAGLRSDPPDSFADDWDESVKECERLRGEIEAASSA